VEDLGWEPPTHADLNAVDPRQARTSPRLQRQELAAAVAVSLQPAEHSVGCGVLRDSNEHKKGLLQPTHEDVDDEWGGVSRLVERELVLL
jgi:hypothetical protein